MAAFSTVKGGALGSGKCCWHRERGVTAQDH